MNTLPAPILLIFGPIIAAAITLLLGRWHRVQTLAGLLLVGILALWLTNTPLAVSNDSQVKFLFSGDTWVLLGRPFVLTEGLKTLILALILGLGLVYLLSYFFPQGRSFIPASLAAIAPLSAALMIQLFTFGMLFLVIGISFLVMAYRPMIRRTTSGGLRYLIFFVLAVPLMLFGGWLFDSGQATLVSTQITGILILAFAIMLAGFPLFIWVYPVVAEAPFFIPAIIFGIAQTVVITFIFSLLKANPWLADDAQFQLLLRWSALGTILVATLLAITAKDWRSLVGYILLFNMGIGLLTLITPLEIAWDIAILTHISRFFALLLLGGALSIFITPQERGIIEDSRGLGRQTPFRAALLFVACLTLLGAPLTIGFPAQYAIFQALDLSSNLSALLILILSLAGGIYAILRVSLVLLQNPQTAGNDRETSVERGLIALVLFATLFFALYPQPLLIFASQLTRAISS